MIFMPMLQQKPYLNYMWSPVPEPRTNAADATFCRAPPATMYGHSVYAILRNISARSYADALVARRYDSRASFSIVN